MSNHAHLIISAKENNVSSVLGDFKKHTSKQIIKAIKEHPGESRREWMLKIFKEAGEQNSRNDSPCCAEYAQIKNHLPRLPVQRLIN
jgi:REP element-mobilizing transposase RayT